jgi:type II secretory pathway pseudopilin PulG
MRRLAALRGQAGYTVAEMLVTAAVIGLVMAGLTSLIMTGSQTWVVGANRAEAVQNGRLVLFRMAQEIRNGGADPRNTASFPAIQRLAPPAVGFVISNDWSADGAIDPLTPLGFTGGRGEQITYDFTAGNLRRRESMVDGAPVVITEVNAITFTYRDADDNDITASAHLAGTAPNIRTVEITVTTDPDNQAGSTSDRVSVTSTIRARVRNR